MKLLSAAFFLLAGALRGATLELYVAPTGNDSDPGTLDAPFATLTRARDALRTLKETQAVQSGGAHVWLRGGFYDLSAPAIFDERDSGAPDRLIIYSSFPGEEAHLTGARSVDPSWFTLVEEKSSGWNRLDLSARGQVYAADLRAHGINDLGTLKARGFGRLNGSPLELFVNGRPATLARWPNRRDEMVSVAKSLSATQFTYTASRPERWINAPEIWLHGLWSFPWADFHLKVAKIDPATKTISLVEGPASFGIKDGQPYYAYNLLEELDEPGEYYLDRDAGVLYLWPPASVRSSTFQVSMLAGPVLQLSGARYISFCDLVIEASRGRLVQIEGGDHVTIERSLLCNAGECAATIGGHENGVDQCEIVDCGEDGVRLTGGSRAALTSGNNFVTQCRIHRIARLDWTYHPAVHLLDGCGNIVAHNLFDDLPHNAVLFSGNNHRIEGNEIHRACRITNDAGAIYSGRDWGYRGNLIRHNFIHHINSARAGEGAFGVYLDDAVSGIEVSGNVFYAIHDCAIFCGGGRNVIMRNNIIAESGLGHGNGDYARLQINNRPGDPFNLLERLSADGIKYQDEPWASAYPECAAIPNSWEKIQSGLWRSPESCLFDLNIGWANTEWIHEKNDSGTGIFSVYSSIKDNEPAHAPLFEYLACIDRSRRASQLRGTVPGFEPVPFASIGRSFYGWPAARQPPPVPLLEGRAASSTRIDLEWSDDGNLPKNQESGFVLEGASNREGPWETIESFGPDTDFFGFSLPRPMTEYFFRVRAFNAAGSVYSNILRLSTNTF